MGRIADVPLVAIQVICDEEPRLLLSPAAQKSISAELADSWTIRWMPVDGTFRTESYSRSQSPTTLLYLLGIYFLSLSRPSLDEILTEAGPDIWDRIRNIVLRVHKQQCKRFYRVVSCVYMILELREEFIALEFLVEGERSETTDARIDREITAQVLEVSSSWNRIMTFIEDYQTIDRRSGSVVGYLNQGRSTFFIVHSKCGKEWRARVEPIDSAEFFERIYPKRKRYCG